MLLAQQQTKPPVRRVRLAFGETLASLLVRRPFLNARGLQAGVDFLLSLLFFRHATTRGHVPIFHS